MRDPRRRRSLGPAGTAALAALAAGALACGPATRPSDDERLLGDVQPSPAEGPAPPPEPAAPPDAMPAEPLASEVPAAPRSASGTIARAELVAVLDAGPAAFLGSVSVRATFGQDAPSSGPSARGQGGGKGTKARRPRTSRLAGWEILSFFPGDPRYRTVDLVAGDVVRRVNGKLIERPDDLIELWESLRFARELTVDYLRGDEPRTLRYDIR